MPCRAVLYCAVLFCSSWHEVYEVYLYTDTNFVEPPTIHDHIYRCTRSHSVFLRDPCGERVNDAIGEPVPNRSHYRLQTPEGSGLLPTETSLTLIYAIHKFVTRKHTSTTCISYCLNLFNSFNIFHTRFKREFLSRFCPYF